MKEKLYLVTKSKSYYHNVLAYNPETSEYVYLHNNQEIWREKASPELFNYMNKPLYLLDIDYLENFDIYNKYSKSCQEHI